MPRAKSLSLSDIAVAALDVADREGLSGLSMRSVADELGMSTMALYRYVTDRDHVERLIVDLVLSRVDTAVSPRLGWRARASTLIERARAAVIAHPAIVPLLLVHRSSSEHSTRWGEAVLSVLADAGLTGRRRAFAFRALLAHLIGSLQLQQLGPLDGAGTRALAALPDGMYPLLAETARHAQNIDPDVEFRQGLMLVMRGIDPTDR